MVPFGTRMQVTDGTPRARIIDGLVKAIAKRGYSAATIADIVRHARVSKRTFYEHFEDKEACFLAAYEAAATWTMATIAPAVASAGSWEEQISAAARAYFSALESQGALARTFLLEIQAVGPRGLKLRREVNRRFAQMLRSLVEAARQEQPKLRPLSERMATALIGGINEMLLLCVEEGGEGLSELGDTTAELLGSVLRAPRPARLAARDVG
jgi:AcrR family transcriptional regulator